MLNSPLFVEGHKYWGMTREEIKHLWKVKAREASEAGTKIHKQIEEFYKSENIIDPKFTKCSLDK